MILRKTVTAAGVDGSTTPQVTFCTRASEILGQHFFPILRVFGRTGCKVVPTKGVAGRFHSWKKISMGHWWGPPKSPCSSTGHCCQSLGRQQLYTFRLKKCSIFHPWADCLRCFLLRVCDLSGFSFFYMVFFISGLAWEDESWWVELAKQWCKAVGHSGHSWPLVWEYAADLELGIYPSAPTQPFLCCTIIKSLDTWKWELFMKQYSPTLCGLLIVSMLLTKFLLSSHLLIPKQWELIIIFTTLKFLVHHTSFTLWHYFNWDMYSLDLVPVPVPQFVRQKYKFTTQSLFSDEGHIESSSTSSAVLLFPGSCYIPSPSPSLPFACSQFLD